MYINDYGDYNQGLTSEQVRTVLEKGVQVAKLFSVLCVVFFIVSAEMHCCGVCFEVFSTHTRLSITVTVVYQRYFH